MTTSVAGRRSRGRYAAAIPHWHGVRHAALATTLSRTTTNQRPSARARAACAVPPLTPLRGRG
eukprot:2785976-Prymnesium_polylepis.1